MKNSKLLKGQKKYRRIEKAFAIPLAKNLFSKIHRYSEVQCEGLPPKKSVRLPTSAFQPSSYDKGSIDFTSVSSTKPAPQWPSPGATNWGQAAADLALLEEAHKDDKWHCIHRA
eukprot:10436242-Lingulodinium_polyedra.AAC.1